MTSNTHASGFYILVSQEPHYSIVSKPQRLPAHNGIIAGRPNHPLQKVPASRKQGVRQGHHTPLEKTKRKRQQCVAADLVGQRHNSREVGNGPAARREAGKIDHTPSDRNDECVHPLKVAHNAVETDAEARSLEFLSGGGPFHIDAAGMAEQRFAHVEGEAAEEEDEL